VLSTVDGGLTIIIHDRSPEGSVTQLHEGSVLRKTPLFQVCLASENIHYWEAKLQGRGWGQRRTIGESVQ